MSDAIIIDVETASLFGEVIELSYACLNGMVFAEPVSMKFKPAEQFDPRAVAVHKILPEDVALCPPSSTVLSRVPNVKYWIGHNVVYDWERMGRPVEVRLVCTLRLAEIVWPKLNSFKLSSLYVQLFGMNKKTIYSISDAHSASCDVRMTANVLWRLMKETNVTDVSQFPFIESPCKWSKNVSR